LRILIPTISTPKHREGGMERHLELLVRLLKKMGHEPHLLTTSFPSGSSWEECPVHVVPTRPAFFGYEWWVKSREKFIEIQKTVPFDCLLSEGAAAAPLLSLRERPPAAAFLQGVEAENYVNQWAEVRTPIDLLRYAAIKSPEIAVFTAVEHHLWRRAETLWPIADHIARRLKKLHGAHPSSPIDVFPNWIDEDFRPGPDARSSCRRNWGIPEGEPVFLFNAVFSRQKGAHIALRAFASHARTFSGSHLVMIGDGVDKQRLESDIHRMGLASRVRMTGQRPHDDIADLLSGADVFVMPTLRIEGLPYTLLEAGWTGLPVIATPRGGNEEVLGTDALFVPVNDADSLAEAMTRLARSPEERAALANRFKERTHRLFNSALAEQKLSSGLDRLRPR